MHRGGGDRGLVKQDWWAQCAAAMGGAFASSFRLRPADCSFQWPWVVSGLCHAFLLSSALTFATASLNPRNFAFVGYSESARVLEGGKIDQDNNFTLTTRYGNITVLLEADAAPLAVDYIKKLVREGLFDGCAIYRAEPPGDTVDAGHEGVRQGYALVQAGLYTCGRQQDRLLPIETTLKNERGAVSLITGTSEFFVNIEAHPEWDGSFSVFGRVQDKDSFHVLEKLLSLPVLQEQHPTGTVLRILKDPVPFVAHLGRR